MEVKRDPRIDPRRGDVLRKGRTTRFVTRRFDGFTAARVRVTWISGERICGSFLPNWRRWARDAEVIEEAIDAARKEQA